MVKDKIIPAVLVRLEGHVDKKIPPLKQKSKRFKFPQELVNQNDFRSGPDPTMNFQRTNF